MDDTRTHEAEHMAESDPSCDLCRSTYDPAEGCTLPAEHPGECDSVPAPFDTAAYLRHVAEVASAASAVVDSGGACGVVAKSLTLAAMRPDTTQELRAARLDIASRLYAASAV